MKRYLVIAAMIATGTGTANGQTAKQVETSINANVNKVTWTSGQDRTTVHTNNKGQTTTSHSYTSPKVKITYGVNNTPTISQSNSSLANLPTVGLTGTQRADTGEMFSIRVDGKEVNRLATWSNLNRMYVQVDASKQGKTFTIFQGGAIVDVVEPKR